MCVCVCLCFDGEGDFIIFLLVFNSFEIFFLRCFLGLIGFGLFSIGLRTSYHLTGEYAFVC